MARKSSGGQAPRRQLVLRGAKKDPYLTCTNPGACWTAATLGDLHTFQTLTSQNNSSGRRPQKLLKKGTLAAAARGGHTSILDYAWKHMRHISSADVVWKELGSEGIFPAAAEAGRIEVFQWAEERGKQFQDEGELCLEAAAAGQLGALKWLRAHNCPWDERTLETAVHFGWGSLLCWAARNGAPLRPGGGVPAVLAEIRKVRRNAVMALVQSPSVPKLEPEFLMGIMGFAELW